MVFIEVNRNGMTALVGVVYLRRENIDIFVLIDGGSFRRHNNIIVMGDFNNDLYDPVEASKMRSSCNRLNISL